jgi:hypothetical protein
LHHVPEEAAPAAEWCVHIRECTAKPYKVCVQGAGKALIAHRQLRAQQAEHGGTSCSLLQQQQQQKKKKRQQRQQQRQQQQQQQ